MSELKPCPFCGTVPQIEGDPDSEDYVRGHNLGFVECKNNSCPIAGAYFSASTQKEATAMWNTRPIEDKLRAQLAARDALIERLVEAGENLTTFGSLVEAGELQRAYDILGKWTDATTEYQAMKGGEG